MSVYEKVFNKNVIFDTIFLNVKAVTEYPSVKVMKKENPEQYVEWVKYITNKYGEYDDSSYVKHACYLPEFSKIVGITYGTVKLDEDKLVRNLSKVIKDNEIELIDEFFLYLHKKHMDGSESRPKIINNLCGHNIMGFDIPFLIKRYLKLKSLEDNKEDLFLPVLLKLAISAKPWESNVIDTIDVVKFGGNNNISMSLVSNLFNFKKNVTLVDNNILSVEYWDDKKTINNIINQSLNLTNLSIQFLNLIRSM